MSDPGTRVHRITIEVPEHVNIDALFTHIADVTHDWEEMQGWRDWDADVSSTVAWTPCHCGEPVYFHNDIEPGFTRGLCRTCDEWRCDAYPGACALGGSP